MRASQISRSNTPPLGVSTVAVRAAGAAFNQLRTVEQLGYIVGVFASISEGVGSFGALVTLLRIDASVIAIVCENHRDGSFFGHWARE